MPCPQPRGWDAGIRLLCGLWGIRRAEWSAEALTCPQRPGSPAECPAWRASHLPSGPDTSVYVSPHPDTGSGLMWADRLLASSSFFGVLSLGEACVGLEQRPLSPCLSYCRTCSWLRGSLVMSISLYRRAPWGRGPRPPAQCCASQHPPRALYAVGAPYVLVEH